MDKLKFAEACKIICEREPAQKGIGTLGEKTLHAVLKYYFDPHDQNQEIKVGPYVADIVGEDGIIEIQTRNLERLHRKLDAFLPYCRVTVVYPVIHRKWLAWIDPTTGEVSKQRRSPKTGMPSDALREISKLERYLLDPNFSLCLLLFDGEEYRNLNGWSKDRKRGSSREERIPLSLEQEYYLDTPRDYDLLLPQALPEHFTSQDLQRAARIHISSAQQGLLTLYRIGTVQRIGKQGRSYLYQRNFPSDIEITC